MKKFFIFFCILGLAVILSLGGIITNSGTRKLGASSVPRTSGLDAYTVYTYTGGVYQVFNLVMNTPGSQHVFASKIAVQNHLHANLSLSNERRVVSLSNGSFTFGMDYYIHTDGAQISVSLAFDNYESFLYFNNFDNTTTTSIERTIFFQTRTQRIENPFTRITNNTSSASYKILQTIAGVYDGDQHRNDFARMILVYQITTRATSTSANRSYRSTNGWNHYFHAMGTLYNMNYTDVIIIHRFANPPMWYILGVALTALFMVSWYIVYKKRFIKHEQANEPSAIRPKGLGKSDVSTH